MRRWRMLWSALVAVAGLWLALCLLAFLFQDRLIFFPGPPPASTPADAALEFEALAPVTSDGVRLAAWWIPFRGAKRAVLVCHGNAASIEQRLDLARLFHRLGWSTLLFDYRGYGASEGSPSIAGLALDADAALEALRERAPDARVVAWGESLGGGVAAELAERRNLDLVVLESAFSSLSRIAQDAYPLLPVRLLLRADLDTLGAVQRSPAAVFVLHGVEDSIVPVAHGRALHDAARGRKELGEFSGGHNDRAWAEDEAIVERLRRFVDA